jgi:endonuclease YncB( thermonuclease family)
MKLVALVTLLGGALAASPAHAATDPVAHAAGATCADYETQAEAQRAADTRDADGDGVYCEDLPCPCAGPGQADEDPPAKSEEPAPRPRRRRVQRISARITDVVDGDTVKIRAYDARRPRYTVRLIGIDTRETVRPEVAVECGGREAKSHLLRAAFTRPQDRDDDGLFDTKGGQGRRATVVTDPSQDTFDRYGRLLAYLTTRQGTELGRRQLAAGWAEVYVYERSFRRYRGYARAARSARSDRRGVHRQCGGDFHRPAR